MESQLSIRRADQVQLAQPYGPVRAQCPLHTRSMTAPAATATRTPGSILRVPGDCSAPLSRLTTFADVYEAYQLPGSDDLLRALQFLQEIPDEDELAVHSIHYHVLHTIQILRCSMTNPPIVWHDMSRASSRLGVIRSAETFAMSLGTR
jgi:hypothetical protein